MARAVYAPAIFVRSSDSTLTLSVPNAVHRTKCEEQRTVVQEALAKFAGTTVSIELLDGDGGDGGGARSEAGNAAGGAGGAASEPTRSPSSPSDRGDANGDSETGAVRSSSPRERGLAAAAAAVDAAHSPDDEATMSAAALPDDDEVDLDDLVDAPPETVKTPIDRLAEAFPGSELIEEAG